MKHKIMISSLILFSILSGFITGCSSNKEIEDLALASLWGIDLVTENGVDKYEHWGKLMIPSDMGKQNNQAQESSPSETLISGEGRGFFESTNDVMERLSQTPFYGHGTATIVGSRLAERKMRMEMEIPLSFSDTRPNVYFFVTKGQASQIVQQLPLTTSTLTQQIKAQADKTAQTNGQACGVTLGEFSEWILSPDRDALLPEIELSEPKKGETVSRSVIVQGFGVFRDSKLVGWLDKEESTGYLLITKNLKNSFIPISFTKDDNLLSYLLVGSKSKIYVEMTGGKPSFKIRIQTLGMLYETDNLNFTLELIKPLEQQIADKIREYPLKTINKAKEYDADFLGLMQKLHRYNPSAWQAIAPNWRESFREANVEVEVDAKILGRGTVSKSWIIKP